jgi:hypothetical protein
MAMYWKQKLLGCALYDLNSGKLSIMEDAYEGDDMSMARLSK